MLQAEEKYQRRIPKQRDSLTLTGAALLAAQPGPRQPAWRLGVPFKKERHQCYPRDCPEDADPEQPPLPRLLQADLALPDILRAIGLLPFLHHDCPTNESK